MSEELVHQELVNSSINYVCARSSHKMHVCYLEFSSHATANLVLSMLLSSQQVDDCLLVNIEHSVSCNRVFGYPYAE